MGEIKSVKVDNWGVFFLQKLQNFFNKTDYCDLTLQFNDNSQLKVHRLVLNACTDYFNILEQTCEMIEDILIMPPGLQADVVVPIVNFMYTGTLEFELKMYGRLLKTAKDMNMTVLLKLLEAHRRTMEGNKTQTLNKMTPKALRRIPYNPTGRIAEDRTHTSQSTSTTPQRRSQLPHNTPQYKTLQIKPVTQSLFPRRLPESAQILSKYPHTKTPVKGPSRFDCNEDALPPETFEKSFDNISYESRPLICKEEPDTYDYDNLIRKHETYASPFEQLRRGYTNINNNKRPSSSVSSYESPPEKKPNIQDVKEYSEQQRVRKQIAEEFGDDQEYDEVLDDEFHNDDDDDDYVPPQSVRRQVKQQQQQHSKVLHSQKIAKQDGGPRPTIVVRDSTTTNVNHAKIISEVLRKYPHLVKNNKNIKLKIMPQSSNAQKIVIKKENTEVSESSLQIKEPTVTSPELKRTTLPSIPTTVQAVAPAVPTPPRRIDSKTMHALIALGAENKEGPWLCLKCGVNGRPISIPSYRGFRRHLINTHKQKIDSRLCEHCGWRSSNNKDLAYHLLVTHSVKSPLTYNFPKCQLCTEVLIDNKDLKLHMSEKHAIKKEKQTCVYCNRSFTDSLHIYTHMKAFHRERSIEDGIFDFSEDEEPFDEETETLLPGQTINDSKIKIISDISLPKNLPIIQKEGVAATATTLGLDANTELEVTVPTTTNLRMIGNTTSADSDLLTTEYIGTDSSQGPKFVNADGNEMELTPAQREEIISQLDQQHDGIVMVLNEEPYENSSVVKDNTVAATTSEQVSENSMFIVCDQEAEAVSEQSTQSSLDKTKSKSKDKDPLEWGVEETSHQSNSADKEKKNNEAGNEVSDEKSDVGEESDEKSLDAVADGMSKEMEDKDKSNISQEMSKANKSPHDSLEMKLKLLTDWTDDEDEQELEEKPNAIEKNNLDLDRSNDEKNNSKEEILFETIAEVVDPDMRKDDNGKEKSEVATGKDEETEKDKPTRVENFESDEKERKHSELDNNQQTEVEEYREKSEEKDKVKGDSETNIKTENEESKEGEACRETTEKSVKPVDCEDTVETSTEDVKKEITSNLITKAELRNIMSDWVDDDEDEDEEL